MSLPVTNSRAVMLNLLSVILLLCISLLFIGSRTFHFSELSEMIVGIIWSVSISNGLACERSCAAINDLFTSILSPQ